jgi:hypothetical protein
VQQRVERSGTQFVAVPGELFDHPQTENRTLASVIQDVDADQARIEFLIASGLDVKRVHRI